MKLLINNLTKKFDDKIVLNSASCTFEKGKIYGLLGRNGAGKTTLFNCISKQMSIDNGKICLDREENSINYDYSSDDIGFVYTHPVLPDFMTGYEFVKFFIDINKAKIKKIKSVDEYLNFMQIDEKDRYKLIKEYSEGMKNKLQMLIFLILEPSVILLDEPLSSFDVVISLEIKNLIKEIKKDHIIILSTHILELAKDMCDSIVILNDGKLELLADEKLKSKDFENNIIEILKEKTENA